MDWMLWLLILILVGMVVICVFGWLLVSGVAQVVSSQKALTASMQTLSDQMADLEERTVETQGDVRKVSQHFINFAKGVRSEKSW